MSKKNKDIKKLKELIDELVSTEVNNDGQGGIESQTGDDLMGYNHDESGPLHQTAQPGEPSKHMYFGSGGGTEQAGEQSSSASESGKKEQEEGGE